MVLTTTTSTMLLSIWYLCPLFSGKMRELSYASRLSEHSPYRTALIMLASYPVPAFFPKETIPVYDSFLYLKWTWAVPFAAVYAVYYLCLEPVAAVRSRSKHAD